MGGLHGRGGRGCGGIPCHHENLGPLGVPGSRMPVQPPGARTSGSLPRARPNLGLHAYLRPAHALQLCVEHGCKGDKCHRCLQLYQVQLYSVSRVRARRIVYWSSLASLASSVRLSGRSLSVARPRRARLPDIRIRAHVPRPREHTTDNIHMQACHAQLAACARSRVALAQARGSRAGARSLRRMKRPSRAMRLDGPCPRLRQQQSCTC